MQSHPPTHLTKTKTGTSKLATTTATARKQHGVRAPSTLRMAATTGVLANPLDEKTRLSNKVFERFMELPQGDAIQAEYIWIGGSGQDLRCKTRTITKEVKTAADLPIWNFDGSSTGQAPGVDSEVMLYPRVIYKDPMRGGNNILVMCDCFKPDGSPIPGNTRVAAAKAMDEAADEVPWFGIEQEYTVFEADGVTPFGWPKGGFPGAQGES